MQNTLLKKTLNTDFITNIIKHFCKAIFYILRHTTLMMHNTVIQVNFRREESKDI